VKKSLVHRSKLGAFQCYLDQSISIITFVIQYTASDIFHGMRYTKQLLTPSTTKHG